MADGPFHGPSPKDLGVMGVQYNIDAMIPSFFNKFIRL
jgi:hypothetical protein